jgi:CRP-like cAMP-binding protein
MQYMEFGENRKRPHQEIADLAGVHRVTVSRTITELRRQGVLDCHRGYMVVRDRAVLAEFAAIQN